jgi:heptosyltransferase-2
MPRWLGDAVHASPALASLKGLAGLKHLALAAPAEHQAYYEALGWSDGFHAFSSPGFVEKVKGQRFDVGILFPRSFHSAWTLWRCGVRQRLGIADQGRSLLLTRKFTWSAGRKEPLRLEYLALAQAAGAPPPQADPFVLLRASFPGKAKGAVKTAVIHPGAAFGRAKVWPLDRYEALARGLSARGVRVLALGGKAEAQACVKVALAGKGESAAGLTDLRGSMELLSMAGVFIGGDSGPLHLAAALGRPVVGIYGSTSPLWTPPAGARATALWGRTTCSPCFRRDCSVGFRCLNLVSVEAVLRAALAKLGA